MEIVELGNSNIKVSKLCLGSLTMTPFQANLPIKEGAYLIEYAYDRGVNFLDTAELYENYGYIKEALKGISRDKYIIATKTYAYDESMAKASLEKALNEIDTNYIDLFLLHEQESVHTIRGHYEALEYFIKAKEEGKVRAVGISTHRVSGVQGANKFNEIEIIHPIINKYGIGISDGSVDDMISQLTISKDLGKGVYGMKPLGGGHLINKAQEALKFVKDLECIDSIAIGMQSIEEIDCNIGIFNNDPISSQVKELLFKKKRRLLVADYCQACGNCVEVCNQNGISIVDGCARPNDNCILCGYCAKACPDFCIKVI